MKFIIPTLTTGTLLLAACHRTPNTMNRAEYSGKDLSREAAVLRDKQTKAAFLKVEELKNWTLYAGASVAGIDFSRPLLQEAGEGTFALAVSDSVRSYFQLVAPDGKAILAERHLPMTGGYNFRDLGGIATTDGRFVKWGTVVRSDDMHTLTDADLHYLSSVPLTTIVDFRSRREIQAAPDRIPASVVHRRELSMDPGDLMNALTLSETSERQLDSLMMEMYRMLVSDSACVARYRDFFALLQDPDNLPLLFHCSAGKDRTGVGTALLLLGLGTDPQVVMDDYLSSNGYLTDKYGPYLAQYPQLAPLFGVKAEFLQAALDQIRTDYGSVERFLTDALDTDLQKLQHIFLY